MRKYFAIALSLVLIVSLSFCKVKHTQPVIIWTNEAEFASYAELFNASQDKVKAVVLYKKNPVEAFPPSEDEEEPDIVVGQWLKNKKTRRNFIPIDYLFTDQHIDKHIFYPQLLSLGSIDNKQYLLPVSFNLPAVVFSAKNEQSIPDTYMLSLEQIRDTAALFNTVKNDDIYTKMGFAPRWIPEFLYQSLKIMGANFSESSDVFSWDTKAVENTVAFLQDWTKNYNTSTTAEQDYQFKYLYTQELDWISSDRSLFTYTTSSELFHLSSEKLDLLDYRWIHNDTTICIDDAIISMGIYKYSQNIPAAEHFIIWFMNEENQKSLLQAKEELNLYTKTFGIADGFSSIQSVNERVYPIFYKNLFGKLPIADYLQPPNILPGKWESIKERVIIPYIVEAVDTTKDEPTTTMHTLVANWKKQFF